MIQYIKIAIMALISSVMMPLPASSSAHISFLNKTLSYTADASILGFYYAVFSLAFCIVVFFNLRKIYSKVFSSMFKSKNKEEKIASANTDPPGAAICPPYRARSAYPPGQSPGAGSAGFSACPG